MLLAPSLMLYLAAGCSSTATPMSDGSAGSTGAGGSTGGGGASGADAGDVCVSLMTTYAAAYQRAIACNPYINSLQCTQVASPSLPCQGCVQHVNDTTELDQIRAQYDAAKCPPVPCPAIPCHTAGTGACLATDGGATGTCVSLFLQ